MSWLLTSVTLGSRSAPSSTSFSARRCANSRSRVNLASATSTTSRMERGASHMRMKSGWVGKSGWMENRSTAAPAGSLMGSCLRRGANWVTSTSDNGNCRMTARAGILCSSSWRCRSHASMQAAKYNFKTGTKGGLTCVSKLIRAYGRRVQDKKVPGLPIVELRADHYRHRTYGKIFFPVMHIVGWTDADGKPLSIADDLNDEISM